MSSAYHLALSEFNRGKTYSETFQTVTRFIYENQISLYLNVLLHLIDFYNECGKYIQQLMEYKYGLDQLNCGDVDVVEFSNKLDTFIMCRKIDVIHTQNEINEIFQKHNHFINIMTQMLNIF